MTDYKQNMVGLNSIEVKKLQDKYYLYSRRLVGVSNRTIVKESAVQAYAIR